MEFEIVTMKAAHVSQVAALERACFPDPWSENSVASELENPLSLWLVAQDRERVLGYVGSQSVLGQADMMNLAVAPQARRQGVARCLIRALEQSLRARQVHSLTLEVRASNQPARALYEAVGFQQVGRRPRYYLDPREDALILRKEWNLYDTDGSGVLL